MHRSDTTARRASRRWAWRLFRLVIVLYLGVLLLLMIFEESLIFPAPAYRDGDWEPESFEFEEVTFSADDGTRLHGWFFAHASPRGYLLYSHGNGTFVPHLGQWAAMLRDRYQLAVLIWDYRGYGKSEGKPNESGVVMDAQAALAWLANRGGIPRGDVIQMGRSLGGAVAVNLAVTEDSKGLVLINTFSSMTDVAAYHYPWFPIRRCLRTRFESSSKIAKCNSALLQFHGTADQIVPYQFGKQLLEAAGMTEKQFISVQGGNHNDPLTPEFYEKLDEFLRQLLR